MQIKTKKNSGFGAEYIEVYAVEKGKPVFACDATLQRERKNRWLGGGKWSKWTISFGSCNADIDFMEKRVKVINKALALARKLNKQ